jgi:acyl carrier protein
MEQTIAREWEETLGISQVGVHDNFFDLGGNSLVGVKLVARLRDRFGLSFPAVTLYEGPTVHALAKLLKASAGGDTGQETEATAEGQSRGERRRARRQRKQGGAAGEED